MFNRIYFEISGKCNGRCHWCQTGRKNKENKPTGGFVNVGEFENTLLYLLKKKAINNQTTIALYNWGEPFLHPDLTDIIDVLNNMDINWQLSTNASKPVTFSGKDTFKRCQYLCFSMSGFSQDSYDKMHGFNFQKIVNNIVSITGNVRSCGLSVSPIIAFHIYQHNLDELREAMHFAAQHKLAILPSYAFINDHERQIKYLNDQLEYEDLSRAAKELFLFYFSSENFLNRPAFTSCSQFSFLSLDPDCNLITCCGDSTVIGKVNEIDLNEINSIRRKSKACKKCIESGAYFMGHNVPCPSTIINGTMKELPQFLRQKNAVGFVPQFVG